MFGLSVAVTFSQVVLTEILNNVWLCLCSFTSSATAVPGSASSIAQDMDYLDHMDGSLDDGISTLDINSFAIGDFMQNYTKP